MRVMKQLLIPFMVCSFSFPTIGQSQVPAPPPPPPPRAKSEASKRDMRIIKEQSQEIQNLKAEILVLKDRVEKLQAELKGKKISQSPEPTTKKNLDLKPIKNTVYSPVSKKEKVKVLKTKTVVKKVSVKKKKKTLKKKRKPTSVAFKSGLNRFKKNCSMFAKPSGKSAKVGKVSAGKKLWIDAHNSSWRKAYKKSGTVYVHKSCF